jgi:four helix bundle protein
MEKDLERRTKLFAIRVIDFVSSLPRSMTSDVLTRQLLRSATSIGANYREANRRVSRADFSNKIATVQKEAAETQYWIELLMESKIGSEDTVLAVAERVYRIAGDLYNDRKALERMIFSTFSFSLPTFTQCAA